MSEKGEIRPKKLVQKNKTHDHNNQEKPPELRASGPPAEVEEVSQHRRYGMNWIHNGCPSVSVRRWNIRQPCRRRCRIARRAATASRTECRTAARPYRIPVTVPAGPRRNQQRRTLPLAAGRKGGLTGCSRIRPYPAVVAMGWGRSGSRRRFLGGHKI